MPGVGHLEVLDGTGEGGGDAAAVGGGDQWVAGAVDDDEVLLRTVLPADQVAAIAPGPAPRWIAPQWTSSPLPAGPPVATREEFVRAVQALPGWRAIDLTVGTETLSLRRDLPEESS